MKARNAIPRPCTGQKPATARVYQGEYLPPRHKRTYRRKDIFSFCVGHIGFENLHISWLTESGATPPVAPLALLLLDIPLLLILQKEAVENALFFY
jgi:hypothetical protein